MPGVEACEANDDKGIYAKARKGEVINFPGIDVEYENPVNPDLKIDKSISTTTEAAERILDHIKKYL